MGGTGAYVHVKKGGHEKDGGKDGHLGRVLVFDGTKTLD
jgi:hypothetical protein